MSAGRVEATDGAKISCINVEGRFKERLMLRSVHRFTTSSASAPESGANSVRPGDAQQYTFGPPICMLDLRLELYVDGHRYSVRDLRRSGVLRHIEAFFKQEEVSHLVFFFFVMLGLY